MRYRNLFGFICLCGMVASLNGCTGKIRSPHYYLLNVPPAVLSAAPSKSVLGSVEVKEFRAPAFLRTGPIVYRASTEQLDFYDYQRWAVDPRSAVTNALVQNLQARGVFESVHLFNGRETSDYLVTGSLDQLEEVDEGRDVFVEVRLSAQLTNAKTGQVLWQDASSKRTKLGDHKVPRIVAEMSQSAASAVEHLVSSMQNRLVSMSTSPASGQAGQQ